MVHGVEELLRVEEDGLTCAMRCSVTCRPPILSTRVASWAAGQCRHGDSCLWGWGDERAAGQGTCAPVFTEGHFEYVRGRLPSTRPQFGDNQDKPTIRGTYPATAQQSGTQQVRLVQDPLQMITRGKKFISLLSILTRH